MMIIRINELDLKFRDEIVMMPGGENIKMCYQCGTCTASCPVTFLRDDFNPRKIIKMAIIGMRERVLNSNDIWLCTACYSCHERCPQDVKITDLMVALTNIASSENKIPKQYRQRINLLKDIGRLLEISDFENERRRKFGIPELPTKIDDVGKILEFTHLSEKG